MELFHTDTDYCTLILGVFPLHQIAHVGVSPSVSLKLFGREIIFEVFQPVITVPKRYGRSDGQTTCNLITALSTMRSIARQKLHPQRNILR